MDMNAMNPVLASIFTPECLKPAYYQKEAPLLLSHGLTAEHKKVAVFYGCEGIWFADIFHNGRNDIAIGRCDACPDCHAAEEEKGPSITDPVRTLRGWLRSATILSGSTPEELQERLTFWARNADDRTCAQLVEILVSLAAKQHEEGGLAHAPALRVV